MDSELKGSKMEFENLKDDLGHILDEHLNRTNVLNRAVIFPDFARRGLPIL